MMSGSTRGRRRAWMCCAGACRWSWTTPRCWPRPARCSTACMSTGAAPCCWAGSRHDDPSPGRRPADPGRAGAAGIRLRLRRGAAGRYLAAAGLLGGAGGPGCDLGRGPAGLPGLLRGLWPSPRPDDRYFLVFVPVALAGALVAARLSPAVEAPQAPRPAGRQRRAVDRSRPVVYRLCALFAVDSLGGGFVIQAFVAYWFAARFGASEGVIGVVFFASGLLQAVSFLVAVRLGERFGLLPVMVFTHLPSNLLLAAMAFAPGFGWAAGLWLARVSLSQMDVPARQAYVMALVDPGEQTGAAAYTNTARYLTRPLGPVLAGAAQSVALGQHRAER